MNKYKVIAISCALVVSYGLFAASTTPKRKSLTDFLPGDAAKKPVQAKPENKATAPAPKTPITVVPTKPQQPKPAQKQQSKSATDHKLETEKIGSLTVPKMPEPPKKTKPVIPKEKSDNEKKSSPAEQKPLAKEAPDPKPSPAKKLSDQEKKKQDTAEEAIKEDQKISFYFEDATLENLIKYIESLFDVKFLPDDAVQPLIQGGGTTKGHKISFKTNKPLSRQEAWNIFVRFLDLAQLALVPGPMNNFYRITATASANKDPLPIYFGTDPNKLPENASKIRYVFFVKNNPIATVQKIMTDLASSTAKVQPFPDLDALILTDKSINIRSLMKIVDEFDKEMPEAMSVIKLRKTEAKTVAALYKDLTAAEAPRGGAGRYQNQRKQPQANYFPADARIIPEERTNSLILLGSKKAIRKIERFIIKHIDVELDMPYSPLHVYDLQYAKSDDVASILSQVVTFGQNTTAGKYGGTLDGQQYFKSVNITSEPSGNRLIIKAEDKDYQKIKDIIEQLDIVQPQVAIEALIVNVDVTDNKELASQIRNKSDGSVLKNVNFQNSGFPVSGGNAPVVTGLAPGSTTNSTLLGNLMTLLTGTAGQNGFNAAVSPGSTLFALGNVTNGIWGVLKVLKSYAHTNVISTPFLLATNKYAAKFSSGVTRRVVTATITGGGENTEPISADLILSVTPQINSEGTINLNIDLSVTEFLNSTTTGTGNGNQTTKHIVTSVSVKNGEVIALGGITKNKIEHGTFKTPILGSIPVLGNLFRTKTKSKIRSNLFVFLSPKIIIPDANHNVDYYTNKHLEKTRENLKVADEHTVTRDPIDRAFFSSTGDSYLESLEAFLTPDEKKEKLRKKTKKKTRGKKVVGKKAKRSSRKKRLAARKSKKGQSS